MITALGHTAFRVEIMEKSLHFYCDILGFRRLFDLDNDKGEPWIIYLKITEGQYIELFYNGTKKEAFDVNETIGFSHFCLEVNDVHEIVEQLRKNGVKLDVEPRQGPDLNYKCWARDPDGNRIEFLQMHPDSPQLER